jgi:NAD(P)-dependent dehydrogenase (short-subunit alcohol dehydrogenase family)
MKFNEHVAIVTGGSSGIGEACVNAFLQNGARVFVFDIQSPSIVHESLIFIKCDISRSEEVAASVQEVNKTVNKVDHLVISAGIYLYARITDTTIKQMLDVVSTNLLGALYTLHYVLPQMQNNRSGTVVLIGSDQSFVGKANSSVYGATKGAIAQLAKSTAIDYAPYNIRVNCVCPGTIDTPLVRDPIREFCKTQEISEEPIYEALRNAQPISRLGCPEEVASLVLFLSSDQSNFITGSLYPIDGGYTAGVDRVVLTK